ncbi:MAG: D-tyrosyl-tRNA(Tyr) deacylase [Planctomycetes bacterium]|nr:D-tyrosyl-tRNA(Tyr) deacylase [Planctomycetota bacterium]
MRAVIQRVNNAKVEVEGKIAGAIDDGLLVFLSVTHKDTDADVEFMTDKIVNLRIFSDDNGKMNLSVKDIGGSILLISQFTLHSDCRKGRRPGFDQAAPADLARRLYELSAELIGQHEVPCETGVFAAHMHITSLNDGPVTFLLDSTRLF